MSRAAASRSGRLRLLCLLAGLVLAVPFVAQEGRAQEGRLQERSAQGRPAPEKTTTTVYSVAVIPVLPASEIKRRWQPVLDQLAQETGLHFRFRFYEDFAGFESGLAHSEPDFAVMAPLHAWRYRNRYRPLLHGRLPLTGLVVVQKSSPLKQLAELQGRRLSLQEGSNLSANSFVLQTLRGQKIEPELLPVKTESNALRSVVMGRADAAIINNYALKFVPAGILEQLRIIHSTEDLPPPPITGSVRLPAEDVQKVKAAMLHFQESHPQLLQDILMPDIVEADVERDYSMVGKLLPDEAGNGNH
jgi:phosphonate transport system substrate-binding protein